MAERPPINIQDIMYSLRHNNPAEAEVLLRNFGRGPLGPNVQRTSSPGAGEIDLSALFGDLFGSLTGGGGGQLGHPYQSGEEAFKLDLAFRKEQLAKQIALARDELEQNGVLKGRELDLFQKQLMQQYDISNKEIKIARDRLNLDRELGIGDLRLRTELGRGQQAVAERAQREAEIGGQAERASNPRRVLEAIFAQTGRQPTQTATALQNAAVVGVPEFGGQPFPMSKGGKTVGGPTVLLVGEGKKDEGLKNGTAEFVWAPEGTVVAPIPHGLEPTMENAMSLLRGQVEKAADGYPSKRKAKKILKDKKVKGKKLSKKQKKFMGFIAGGGEPTRAADGFVSPDFLSILRDRARGEKGRKGRRRPRGPIMGPTGPVTRPVFDGVRPQPVFGGPLPQPDRGSFTKPGDLPSLAVGPAPEVAKAIANFSTGLPGQTTASDIFAAIRNSGAGQAARILPPNEKARPYGAQEGAMVTDGILEPHELEFLRQRQQAIEIREAALKDPALYAQLASGLKGQRLPSQQDETNAQLLENAIRAKLVEGVRKKFTETALAGAGPRGTSVFDALGGSTFTPEQKAQLGGTNIRTWNALSPTQQGTMEAALSGNRVDPTDFLESLRRGHAGFGAVNTGGGARFGGSLR